MEENKKIYYDKQECLDYIKNNSGNIDITRISEDLQYDPEIIEFAVSKNQKLINDFSTILTEFESSKVMRNLFDKYGSELYNRLSPELKTNEDFMLRVVGVYPNAVYNLDDKLQNNLAFKAKSEWVLDYVAQQYAKRGDENYSNYVSKIKKSISKENLVIATDLYGLDKEKYELIKYYDGTMQKLNEIQETGKNDVFKVCIEEMENKNLDINEWKKSFENLLHKFNDRNYQDLLYDVEAENVDAKKLNIVLSQPNYFDIKSNEELEKYQEIKQEVCDAIINGNDDKLMQYPLIQRMNNVDKIKFATLEKFAGYDLEQAKDINKKYLDIENVEAEDKKDVKSLISTVKAIVKEENIENIKNIYELNPVKEELQDISILEQETKKMYMEEYNKTLFDPKKCEEMSADKLEQLVPEGIDSKKYNLVDAGTEFNMIMTAVGAYFQGGDMDYAKSWNREITNSKGFSCSYIGNDMIATAPVQDVCYGFSTMENNSLLMAGDCNLGSATNDREITVNETYVDYQRPQNLKESTKEYNEMVFKREQNGERKQPDYLLVFKKDGKAQNLKQTLKAVDDFKKEGLDLPIVVVDVEKCIESEKNKIENMISVAEQTNNKDMLKEAERKIKTNSKTNANAFSRIWNKCRDVYDKVSTNVKNIVDKSVYEKSYKETRPEERMEISSEIVQVQKEIIKNTQEKGVESYER